MWEAEGDFKLTANVIDFVTQFRPKYSEAADQFEGIAYSGASGYPDVDGWLNVYVRDGSPRAGHVDANGQPDAKLNQLYASQRSETDPQKRISILQDLQRYAATKMYMLLDPGAATTPRLRGRGWVTLAYLEANRTVCSL